jgi:hypothetical protein
MTEQIEVTYLPVVGGAYHMALFYDNGDGQKQVIEVAPQHNLDELSANAVFGELIKEAFLPGNTNDGSPFGYIVGGVRAWDPEGDDLRPREIIATGDNLSARWGALVGWRRRPGRRILDARTSISTP